MESAKIASRLTETRKLIERKFNTKAKDFVEAVCTIEERPIVKFSSNKGLISAYTEAHHRIMENLMWHRNKPVPEEKLKALSGLAPKGILPKSIEVVLLSILKYKKQ